MNFLNGASLAGIAALSIPIIIHLFHKSRFKVVKSTRVREDSPPFDPSFSASLANEPFEEIDPITGARPWMLDVGCRMLNVDGGVSVGGAIRTDVEQEGVRL